MTGPEFRSIINAIGTKPVAFAEYIGINRATVFRWLKDGPPLYAQRVVELLVERKALSATLSKIPLNR